MFEDGKLLKITKYRHDVYNRCEIVSTEILEKTELKWIRRRYGHPKWKRCQGDSNKEYGNAFCIFEYEVYQFIDFFGEKKNCYMVARKKAKELTSKTYYMKKEEDR